MTHPLKTPQALSAAVLMARVPLGVFFLMAGYLKLAKTGADTFVQEHIKAAERFMSPGMGSAFLHTLPYVEMIVGVALIVGIFTRVAAAISSLMLLSFIIAVTGIAFDASGSKGSTPISPNVIYFGLSLLLMTTGGGEMTVDHTFKKSPPGPAKK